MCVPYFMWVILLPNIKRVCPVRSKPFRYVEVVSFAIMPLPQQPEPQQDVRWARGRVSMIRS